MTHNEDRCQLIETKMALIIELLGKDNKSAIINTQCMLKNVEKNMSMGASLVAQSLRICLPMQGTRV